ncbi:MAG: GTPase SAR1 family protein [Cyclobacteriaceae bacterium]|jgi:GTPase SAR1 family protein
MQDGIILDDIAQLALKYITHTSRHVFLTGKAGTGKTTLLRNFLSKTHKRTVVAAPTGIAAINAGGVTLHSLFQLPFGAFVPSDFALTLDEMSQKVHTPTSLIRDQRLNAKKRALLRQIELLIIDEVSMLRADLLDAIDLIMRKVRRQPNRAFGGIQILFIGDLFQLPPVVQREEMKMMSDYYNSMYFFDSLALKDNQPVYIELETVHRQSDQRFVSLLNRIRSQQMIEEDNYLLQEHFAHEGYMPDEDGAIFLTTHNQKAAAINQEKLSQVPSEERAFKAKIEGKFEPHLFPNDEQLVLKEGAQVMFIKNDPTGQQRFFNGKIGQIEAMSDHKLIINCDGVSIELEKFTWENKRYKVDPSSREINEDLVGEFSQFPVRLAWAVTVHKSQGLTFERAILDLEKAFAPGQFYVAMSRLTSLDGLTFSSPIPRQSFEIDPRLTEFTDQSRDISKLEDMLLKDTKDYFVDLSTQAFDFTETADALFFQSKELQRLQALGREDALWNMIAGWIEIINKWKKIGHTFGREIFQIGATNSDEYLHILNNRIAKGVDYFYPTLLDMVNDCRKKGHEKPYKGVAEFQTVWKELYESLGIKGSNLIRAQHLILKASKDEVLDTEELENVSAYQSMIVPYKTKATSDTKNVTFSLYQEGMKIDEIAAGRELSEGTISNHLSFFVSTGEIPVKEFLSKAKLKNILTVSDTIDSIQLTPIKAKLGDEYTYDDIRFAMAHKKFLTTQN